MQAALGGHKPNSNRWKIGNSVLAGTQQECSTESSRGMAGLQPPKNGILGHVQECFALLLLAQEREAEQPMPQMVSGCLDSAVGSGAKNCGNIKLQI